MRTGESRSLLTAPVCCCREKGRALSRWWHALPDEVSAKHQSLHHFVAKAAWDEAALLGAVRTFLLPTFEDKAPIRAWIVDDTGIPKGSCQPRTEASDAEPPTQDAVPTEPALAGDAADKGRNAEVDFHGSKRSNETHASITDPDARLYRRGEGKEAKHCYMGHALMENRNGLVVEAYLTHADGHAERNAALAMMKSGRTGQSASPWEWIKDITPKTS
jgi:hypothetical protein